MILFSATSPGITVPATQAALTAVALPTGAGSTMRIVNSGPDTCFVAIGTDANVLATLPTTGAGLATCLEVLGNSDCVFRINRPATTHIATICRAVKTATLSVYIGDGE